MKKIYIALVLFFVLPLAASRLFAQPKVTVVGGTEVNLGDVHTDITAKKLITIKNDGNDTLIISEVSSTCGCTAALMSNDHILPGDSAILSISFDGKQFNGPVRRTVSFKSNDPTQERVRIAFDANVIKTLTIQPEYVTFNRVSIDSSLVQQFLLRNNSQETIRLLSVTSTKDVVIAKARKTILKPNDTTFVDCTFRPTTLGTVSGNIIVETDHPKVKTVSIRFFGLGTRPTGHSERR